MVWVRLPFDITLRFSGRAARLGVLLAIGGCAGENSTVLLPSPSSGEEARITNVSAATGSAKLDAGETPFAGDAGGPCLVNELRCDGEQLFTCTSGGTWQSADSCATAELCQDSVLLCQVSPESCDSAAPACLPPVCEKFEQRCTGPISERCNSARSGFEILRNCGQPCGGSVCDPEVGCRAQFCETGQYECRNGEDAPPTFCNDTCTAFDLEVQTGTELLGSYCNAHNSGP